MKHAIYILLLISVHSLGFSIVNFQSYMIDKKDALSLGANINIKQLTGNTDVFGYGLEGSIRYKYKNNFILGVGNYSFAEYTKSNLASTVTNKYMFHLRYKYQFYNWLGFEIFSQEEFDEFRRIEDRFVGGGGPRFTFLESKWYEVNLGTAYMLEYNKLIGNTSSKTYPDADKESTFHRSSSYLNLYISLDDNIKLFSTIYYQPAFNDPSNYRLLNENSLKIKVNKAFFITLNYIIAFDSIPPNDVKQKDTKLLVGVGVKLDLLESKQPIQQKAKYTQ